MNDKNLKIIEKLRQKFLNEFESNPQLFHQIDVERVQNENWQIERFILDTDSEEEAYRQLTKCLQWKKSYGLHERKDQYFPKEFFSIFGIEKYSRDIEGRIVMWDSSKNYIKIPDISILFQQFLVHQMEKLDRTSGSKGWISVNDASGTVMMNIDISLAKFRIDLLNYYPQGMKLSFILDMPWLMNSAFKIVKNFMNKRIRDNIILAKKEELTNYIDIDIDLVPISFGGNREPKFDDFLKDYSHLHEMKHLGLTDVQIENFYNTYNALFQK